MVLSPEIWEYLTSYVSAEPRGTDAIPLSKGYMLAKGCLAADGTIDPDGTFNLLQQETLKHELLGYELVTNSSIFTNEVRPSPSEYGSVQAPLTFRIWVRAGAPHLPNMGLCGRPSPS